MSWTLHKGDWAETMTGLEPDVMIADPPYGARTHEGHDAGVSKHVGSAGYDESSRRELSYTPWGDAEVSAFVHSWSERVKGWFCVMSCHELLPVWRKHLEDRGRYVFAPVVCVIRGMTVRLTGDGPSSWAVYLTVARKRTWEARTWGTLPGAYVVTRGAEHIGGKPLSLMNAIVRDYSRPGDLICDPCAGLATTGVAALSLGRRFIGSEIDPETYAKAKARLESPVQIDLLGGGR